MVDLALGAAAGVLASVLFSVGLVLQGVEARAIGHERSRRALVLGLLRRPRWVLGGATMVVGFTFHVVALMLAPLTVVQPSLAAGLLVLLIAGTRMDEGPIGPREIAGVACIAVGLVVLTVTGPTRTTVSAGTLTLALAVGVLAAVAFLPNIPARPGLRGPGRAGLAAAFGAGAAYALTGITTKLVSDALAAGDPVGVVAWLAATMAGALLALVDQTAALHARPATEVGAYLYVMPVVIPVLLAPVLVGESWAESPFGGVPLAASLVAVCAGAAILGNSRRVAAMA